MTIVGAVLTLALLAVIFKLIFSSKRTFDLKSALPEIRGEGAGRLLNMLVICTVLTTTSVIPLNVLGNLAVPAILAVAIGSAVCPNVTDRVLTVFGIVLALAETDHRYGAGTTVLVFVIAMLGLWVMGFVRGFFGH